METNPNPRMKLLLMTIGILILSSACQQDLNEPVIKSSKNKSQLVELDIQENIVGGIVSGIYQNTFIAIEKQEISGFYNTEKNPNNCQFYFKGKYNSESKLFDIQLRNLIDNEILEGTLKTIDAKVNIKTKVNFRTKCLETINKNGLLLNFTKKSNWLKIASVIKENTEIFEEPDETMDTGLKFKKNELLCILEEKNNWYRVESFGKTTNAGWVKKESVE
jgi:hypothetical protein